MTFKIGDRVILVEPPNKPDIPIGSSGVIFARNSDLYCVLWDREELNSKLAANSGLFDWRLVLNTEAGYLHNPLFTLEELTEYADA
jgi:hypothetical protein